MNKWILAAAVSLTCVVNAFAYEKLTHQHLARTALDQSVLERDPEVLQNLGLKPLAKSERFRDSQESSRTIRELVAFGAAFEDAEGIIQGLLRARHHFFDPHYNRPLTISGTAVGQKSPDWALEESGSEAIEGQDFSHANAKQYLFEAITSRTESERKKKFGLFFQAVGHVIHHLQDMAQPEHTRNDAHVHPEGHDPLGQGWYEIYTTREVNPRSLTGFTPYLAEVLFGTPQEFWSNAAGSGIAQFSNRNFVTHDTNFSVVTGQPQTGEYPSPMPGGILESSPLSSPDLLGTKGNEICDEIRQSVPQYVITDCNLVFYQTTVTDEYLGQTVTNKRASTLSVFDQYLKGRQVKRISHSGHQYFTERAFTLNRFNYDAAHQFLLPRAVAYSTGFINYMLRGKIEISLPDRGYYALLDHAVTNNPTAGFTKIKVKLRNATPDLGVVPQEMSNGELYAVAKYRTNPCYQPDLSGEVGEHTELGVYRFPDGCSEDDYYGTSELISISEQKPIFVGAPVSRTTGTEYEFDFSNDVIPIHARELALQIVYSGQLGEEQNAVVVATRDISEPTYINVMNYTDFFHIDGTFYTPEEIRSNPDLRDRMDTNDDGVIDHRDEYPIDPISFEQMSISLAGTAVTGNFNLSEGRYIRLVMLGKTEDKTTGQLRWFHQASGTMQSRQMNISPLLNYGNPSTESRLSAISWHRGIYRWYLFQMTNGIGVAPAPTEYDRMRNRLLLNAGPLAVSLLND